MATLMILMISTSFIRSHRCTTYQSIKSFHQCCCLLLIVRDSELDGIAVSVFRLIVDDDRVVPMHSFKLAATLQHVAAGNPHPLLLRLEMKAGHGAGKATEVK